MEKKRLKAYASPVLELFGFPQSDVVRTSDMATPVDWKNEWGLPTQESTYIG